MELDVSLRSPVAPSPHLPHRPQYNNSWIFNLWMVSNTPFILDRFYLGRRPQDRHPRASRVHSRPLKGSGVRCSGVNMAQTRHEHRLKFTLDGLGYVWGEHRMTHSRPPTGRPRVRLGWTRDDSLQTTHWVGPVWKLATRVNTECIAEAEILPSTWKPR